MGCGFIFFCAACLFIVPCSEIRNAGSEKNRLAGNHRFTYSSMPVVSTGGG